WGGATPRSPSTPPTRSASTIRNSSSRSRATTRGSSWSWSRSFAAPSRAPTRCGTPPSSPASRCPSPAPSMPSTARRPPQPWRPADVTLPRSMTPGTEENPLRVAIVGSGPAGFYAAEQLLRADGVVAEVDVYDRLPTPFGLVRAGVAPDHPKLKSVIRVYEKTAAREGFRFFGGIEVGTHVTPAELAQRYHAVIYTYGTATDRQLGIPGEDLPGSHAATEFVAWYNGHPDFADARFDLSCERAVVIGNGNVAADVTRMLALPHEELAATDAADHAIEALRQSSIREIVVLGRRGPAQAAFTNPEVRELGEMTIADVIVDPAEVELDDASREFLASGAADPTNRRNVEILTEFARRKPQGKERRIVLRFRRSPVE